MNTTTVTDPLHWMPDYCPRCNPSVTSRGVV